MDEVNLAQIGLGRIARHAGAVLHRLPAMGVAFDTQPRQQFDARGRDLREAVRAVARDRDDET
jgi:hypothetical protein